MKKIFIIIIFILLFLSLNVWNKSRPKSIISAIEKNCEIKSGLLRYQVYVLWILPVGEAVLEPAIAEDYQGKKVYHLRAVTRTLPVTNHIFKASAIIESYLELPDLDPVLFKQSISLPGKPAKESEVIYDQVNNTIFSNGIKREVLAHTQDPLSAAYKIRRMDFSKVKSVTMNINTNQRNYILEGSALEGELTLKGKKYDLVYTKSQIRRREKNNPYHRSQVNIVLLKADNENIPLLIKVFASGFPVTARLVEIK